MSNSSDATSSASASASASTSTSTSTECPGDLNMATLDTLPAEMVDAIISHLRPSDLAKLSRVSKKFNHFASPLLWRYIELHRRDDHQACCHLCFGDYFSLPVYAELPRPYLAELATRDWAPQKTKRLNRDFVRRNTNFNNAVRRMYATAGKSRRWVKIAHWIRQLCLTVTGDSPAQIWNVILSLPHLTTVEVIGKYSDDKPANFYIDTFRTPAAKAVSNVRLRGYIPAAFISALCHASASTIINLDLGVLNPPELFPDTDEEEDDEDSLSHPDFIAPKGVLWYNEHTPSLSSLKNILLCRRGEMDDWIQPEGGEVLTFDDELHNEQELEQFASLLRSIRSTVVEICLEQRPLCFKSMLDLEGFSPNEHAHFYGGLHPFDEEFYRRILVGVFDDGEPWPKLQKLTIRGVNLMQFEEEVGESLKAYQSRVLPGVEIEQICGNYMFFEEDTGSIVTHPGVDGLKPSTDWKA